MKLSVLDPSVLQLAAEGLYHAGSYHAAQAYEAVGGVLISSAYLDGLCTSPLKEPQRRGGPQRYAEKTLKLRHHQAVSLRTSRKPIHDHLASSPRSKTSGHQVGE